MKVLVMRHGRLVLQCGSPLCTEKSRISVERCGSCGVLKGTRPASTDRRAGSGSTWKERAGFLQVVVADSPTALSLTKRSTTRRWSRTQLHGHWCQRKLPAALPKTTIESNKSIDSECLCRKTCLLSRFSAPSLCVTSPCGALIGPPTAFRRHGPSVPWVSLPGPTGVMTHSGR